MAIIDKIDAAFNYLDVLIEKALVWYWYLGYGCAVFILLTGIYEFIFNWDWKFCLITIVMAIIYILKTETMIWLMKWRMKYNKL